MCGERNKRERGRKRGRGEEKRGKGEEKGEKRKKKGGEGKKKAVQGREESIFKDPQKMRTREENRERGRKKMCREGNRIFSKVLGKVFNNVMS